MRTIKLIFITLITLSRLSSVYIHYEIYIRDVDYITNQVESLILKLS